jgi:hypothetical protein
VSYYRQQPQAFSRNYIDKLQKRILASPLFVTNNLNRDFIGTKGFSVVFRRSHLEQVAEQFPFFMRYLDIAMEPDCNAFYLNPLLLQAGSRVDPHIDRSLRSYCKTIAPPAMVSVLYIAVPDDLQGGELVLRSHRRQVGCITPEVNTLLWFQGDLTHSVNAVTSVGMRLSLVCEQYNLEEKQLEDIPGFQLESRAVQGKITAKRR